MNGPPKVDHPGTAEDDGGLDPREAAALIEETARQARRQFQPHAPYVAVLGAGVFLFGYGAVWWSMRNQHPYTTGPAGWSIALLYGLIIVLGIASSRLLPRATKGVGGRARRQLIGLAVAVWAAGIGAWTFQGALRYLGVSFEIVYGVYGPTVPLIALCAAAAGFAAAREDWLHLCVAVAIIAVAAGSTFFGPWGAWGLTGLGCCLVLLGYAAALTIQLRKA
jgi:hypothetical protein